MTRSLEFVAYGRPAPKGSKRYGATGQAYEQSRYLPAWSAAVKLAGERARLAMRWRTAAVPCRLDLAFWLARPDRDDPDRPWLHEYPASPPDVDKLARGVADALTQAGVWADDALWVRTGQLDKGYVAPLTVPATSADSMPHVVWVTDAPTDWWSRHPMGSPGCYIKVTRLSDMEDEAQ